MKNDEKWLKSIIKKNFLSTAELGHTIKVSRQYLSGVLYGLYPLSDRVRALIINAVALREQKFYPEIENDQLLPRDEVNRYLNKKFGKSISANYLCTLIKLNRLAGKKILINSRYRWVVYGYSLKKFSLKKSLDK